MNLVNIEASKVVSLTFVRSMKGAPFSLDMLGAVVSRYNFQHFPERLPIPGSENQTKLQTGNFNGVQIDELSVYNDGVIVAARADTDVIEAFLDDIYGFMAEKFFVERIPPETRHYESAVIVTMDERVSEKFSFLKGLYNDLADFRGKYGLEDVDYFFDGFHVEPEPTKTGTAPRFVLERRDRVPFSTNQWFSAGPLRTKDHLAVLENLEQQLLR